jgi:hypothetical protein
LISSYNESKENRIFRSSPTNNGKYLQNFIAAGFGKEMFLQLDPMTHWNSLLSMLERFFELRCVCRKLELMYI